MRKIRQYRKAIGAITGGSLGGAVATILIWVLESLTESNMPEQVEAAVVVLAGAAVAGLLAWLFPNENPLDPEKPEVQKK